MNQEELQAKIVAARAIGLPVFFTATEMQWLMDAMLSLADDIRELEDQGPLSIQDKINLLRSVSIGIKCADQLDASLRP